MSFPIVQAASTTVEETCHLATDVVQGTRYKVCWEDVQARHANSLQGSADRVVPRAERIAC